MNDDKKKFNKEEEKLKELYRKAAGTGLSLLNPEENNFTPPSKKPTIPTNSDKQLK